MNLDPVEVLHHLHLLGYRNVSEKQLADFIRDLKKLIKYDLRKRRKLLEDVDGDLEVDQSKENCFPNNCSVDYVKQTRSMEFRRETRNGVTDSCSSSSISTSSSARSLGSQETFGSRKEDNLAYGENETPKESARKLSANKISHPSYIRSWYTGKKPNFKNDPVARYQWYQSQWNSLKVPGEEAHNQLRWLVRERMLGEDPNPRPTSWTSGRCSRNSGSNFKCHPR